MKPQFFFAAVKNINTEDRTIDVVASTIDKDRDGDIILPSAFKKSIKSFKANPVILACHQHRLQTGSSPVIGSAIPETIKITDKALLFTMKFADTALGEEYWILYRDEHMRAFSVGFIPEKWEDARDDNGRVSHRTYTQVELLETSAVPVPSNRRALARAKGYFGDDDTDEQTKELSERLENLETQLDEIKSLVITDSEGHAKELFGDSDDTTRSAGDTDTAERIVSTLNKMNSDN